MKSAFQSDTIFQSVGIGCEFQPHHRKEQRGQNGSRRRKTEIYTHLNLCKLGLNDSLSSARKKAIFSMLKTGFFRTYRDINGTDIAPITHHEYNNNKNELDQLFSIGPMLDHHYRLLQGLLISFEVKHGKLADCATLKKQLEAEARSGQGGPVHEIVLDAKKTMVKMFGERGPGQWLNIHNFKNSPSFELKETLSTIYDLARLQSRLMDKMVIQEVCDSHLQNQSLVLNSSPIQKVVVVGGGLAGMLSTLECFEAGLKVVLVNKRVDFTLAQLTSFDPKWHALFRRFLGTALDELVLKAIAEEVEEDHRPHLRVFTRRELEKVFFQRLCQIQLALEDLGSADSLKLLYGYSFVTVGESGSGKKEAIIQRNVSGEDERTMSTTSLEFDLLICAAGKTDPICRDRILGVPYQRTQPQAYGVARFSKGGKLQGSTLYNTSSVGASKRHFAYLTKVEKFLREEQLDSHVSSGVGLPEDFKWRYTKLVDKIVRQSGSDQMQLLVVESRTTFQVDCVLDQTMQALITSNIDWKSEQLYTWRKNLERKFFAGLINYLLNEAGQLSTTNFAFPKNLVNMDKQGNALPFSDDKLNFDEFPINLSTFVLTQYTLSEAAKVLEGVEQPIAISVGDNLVNAHFFSGSGLSTARMGIQRAVLELKYYNKNNKITREQLVKQLNATLDIVKEAAIEQGLKFVRPVVEQKIATNIICHLPLVESPAASFRGSPETMFPRFFCKGIYEKNKCKILSADPFYFLKAQVCFMLCSPGKEVCLRQKLLNTNNPFAGTMSVEELDCGFHHAFCLKEWGNLSESDKLNDAALSCFFVWFSGPVVNNTPFCQDESVQVDTNIGKFQVREQVLRQLIKQNALMISSGADLYKCLWAQEQLVTENRLFLPKAIDQQMAVQIADWVDGRAVTAEKLFKVCSLGKAAHCPICLALYCQEIKNFSE